MIITAAEPFYIYIMLLTIFIAHVRLLEKSLDRVGPIQFFMHKLYAVIEPVILRITDYLITKKRITESVPGMALLRFIATASHYLPHGVVITTKAAERFMDYIETVEGPAGARIAVGPCVCQRSLNRWNEPSCKDIVILYGAEIYRHLNLGYRVITAAEAKNIVRQCRDAGLVHSIDFCMQTGKWAFVLCNCDSKICVLTRTFILTGKFIYAGPEIVALKADKCLGEKKCGHCIRVCMFGVNSSTGTKPSVAFDRCLGCGQCSRVCKGKARSMSPRFDYGHERVVPAEILLGQGTGKTTASARK
ncbi:MAG: hypothetical protein KA369_07940 [Spirochaetes bacterium]|nr:hypothetical protein [Spirochaetota bacterium]